MGQGLETQVANLLVNLSNNVFPGFDLKHDIGAIVDIKFMVQYAVLAWTPEPLGLSGEQIKCG